MRPSTTPRVAFQDVRSSPEFVRSNRTMGGGQWDAGACTQLRRTPAGWDVDQLGTDLLSGDVGNLNFLEPDQCDDMHGVNVQGTIAGGSDAAAGQRLRRQRDHLPRRQLHRLPDQEDPGVADLDEHRRSASPS